jgi:hypothetical protein
MVPLLLAATKVTFSLRDQEFNAKIFMIKIFDDFRQSSAKKGRFLEMRINKNGNKIKTDRK